MSNNEHPIAPPPELVEQWFTKGAGSAGLTRSYIATQAARWGWKQRGAANEAELQQVRDEELAACCDAIYEHEGQPLCGGTAEWLRAARRPKPPSLKEQALEAFEDLIHNGISNADVAVIRRAIESIPS